MPEYVRDVDAAHFQTEVVDRSITVPVVVDFWAAWCGPCRVLGPVLERAAAEALGDWELAKVDVDRNQSLAGSYGVQGIPTVIGFRDGEAVARFTGALPETQVRQWLSDLVPSRLDRLAAQASTAASTGDADAARRAFQQVLDADPSHEAARTGLAALLLEEGSAHEAAVLLEGLAPTPQVRHMAARARLGTAAEEVARLDGQVLDDTDDWESRLRLARGLAAAGAHGEALHHLQAIVESGTAGSDQARVTMLDVFEVLGEDPLVAEYRRRLASALF